MEHNYSEQTVVQYRPVPPERLERLLQNATAPRVTEKQIRDNIGSVFFHRWNDTVTICEIKFLNGFSVRGESACVSAENYNEEIGKDIAYKNAFVQAWPLFGFLLAEDIYWRNKGLVNVEGESAATADGSQNNTETSEVEAA